MEQGKIKTSLLYQVSNIAFEEMSIFLFNGVVSAFKKGPEVARAFLVDLWNRRCALIKERPGQFERFDFVDIDREVKIEDFEVTFGEIPDIANVYFVHFPEVDNSSSVFDGACKCLAFVLTKERPRFLTMEYGRRFSENGVTPCFFFGEWVFNYLSGNFTHLNYGTMEQDTIEYFTTIVKNKIS